MIGKVGLNTQALNNLARQVLAEDIGAGDATTLAVIPENISIRAYFCAREDCVLAGLPVVKAIFAQLDGRVEFESEFTDGTVCPAGTVLARVSGPARAILTGERTALNFLQRLCGIAGMARRMVEALNDPQIQILDTRKTTPGLRLLEKYAVLCGGAHAHRFGLYDQILIKDNHLAVAAWDGPGSVGRAVRVCRERYPELTVELEADTLEQVEEGLKAQADIILLDNMELAAIREAVKLRDQIYAEALLEVSGNVNEENIGRFSGCGVDRISCGALTHSVRATDIGLDMDPDFDSHCP